MALRINKGRRPLAPSKEGLEFLTRPLHSTNPYEETVQRLLQVVRLGLIGPNGRLPSERDLSAMLGVGRSTVREALSTLAEAGYTVSRRGRYGGTFVAHALPDSEPLEVFSDLFSPHELADLGTTRRVLEVGAVREAASRPLPASERASLQAALEECANTELSSYRRLDSRLHILFAELSGSASLIQLVADVRTRVNSALDCIPMLAPNLANSHEQHQAISQAILAGHPEEAAAAMTVHLMGTESLLQGFLAHQDSD
ncbi:FadR/GntR family transcriptional regulator [Leucobacter salsicius]|uniref:FadR/GntR family transcriptional regulator n=1 Tax=Leucobacter salsicius TaxID=664638 RepID=UPI000686153E|nr:FCD domain-containing protein [Leucobacter salsicius]